MKKMRNKISGDVYDDAKITPIADDTMNCWKVEFDGQGKYYDHFDEIAEEWEDYEEPKEYWTIDRSEKGGLFVHKVAELAMLPEWVECDEEYGIRFETEEEAEKAVEKLKAWERLKDIGCDFNGWRVRSSGSEGDHLFVDLYVKDFIGCEELLDLLFGGKE